jgi:hypothetical protein
MAAVIAGPTASSGSRPHAGPTSRRATTIAVMIANGSASVRKSVLDRMAFPPHLVVRQPHGSFARSADALRQ